MKNVTLAAILLASCSAAFGARELPNYLPSAPQVDKMVTDYTVADVMGCVCTNWRKLPEGHPFRLKDGEAVLRSEWPGSKIASNIDLFLNYLLLAPDENDEGVLADDLYWILEGVMDVPNADKATAILRVYSGESDIGKRRRLAMFCGKVLPSIVDARLLEVVRDLLDDDTVLETIRPEGADPIVVTVRGKAKEMCKRIVMGKELLNIQMMGSDYSDIFGKSNTEEESCQKLKMWMNNNWEAIATKASEVGGKPNRTYRKPIIRMFEPRQ